MKIFFIFIPESKRAISPNKLTRFFYGFLILSLISCTKNIEVKNPVTVQSFRSFVSGKTFHVTGYYNESGTIQMPDNTQEDVYSFGETLGVMDSKEPCIEYTVPLRIYQEGTEVMIDWVNLVVQYETFVVREVAADYFILEGKEHSIRYSKIN